MIKVLLPKHTRGGDSVLYTQGLLNLLNANKINHQFVEDEDKIKFGDVVMFRFGTDFEQYKHANTRIMSEKLTEYIRNIESKGVMVYPPSQLLQYYENKATLQRLFEDRKVKIPRSFHVVEFIDYIRNRDQIKLFLPVVVKTCYSCSSNGMTQAKTIEELDDIVNTYLKRNQEIMIQQKISFTREARITYYGDYVFHGYYRIKKSTESLSGASNHGSIIRFEVDLEKIKPFIAQFIKQTGFTLGGIDICWENDDLNSEPYVLEVSPIFDVNPPPTTEFSDKPYAEFKKTESYIVAKRESYLNAALHFLKYVVDTEKRKKLFCDIDCTVCDSYPRIHNHPNDYKSEKLVLQDQPIGGAVESNHELCEKYKLIFLTARKSYENYDIVTRKWLYDHDFHYHQLIFVDNPVEKVSIVKAYNGILIDDFTMNHHKTIPDDDINTIKELNKNEVKYIQFKTWDGLNEKIYSLSK